MTAPTLARITGTAWRNTSATSAPEVAKGRLVICRPLLLDESGALVDSASEVRVRTDTAGCIDVPLWPGAWRILLWDGEVIDGPDHTGVVVEAGGVYTLEALRGYVPGPGVSVQVIEVPATLAADVASALTSKAAAAQSATDASLSASDAAGSAAAALAAQHAAETSRDAAQGSASAASTSATNAANSASAASGSASTATTQAGIATTQAGNAADSANAAAQSAIAADARAVAAGLARDGAATARGLSEGARDAAIAAQGLAEGARDLAVAAQLATEAVDINVGTVTTGAPGTPAVAAITGAAPTFTLNLTIPEGDKGDKGDTGPANSLAIGTVTTGAEGTSADATITGTAPSQVLNLTIPRGYAGSPTAYELRGTGMPNGVVTASPGTYYTDTAGTNGAWRWLKKSGTGNTGWGVVHGDTGWRNVAADLVNGWTATLAEFLIRRVNDEVELIGVISAAGKISDTAYLIPSGFAPRIPNGTSIRVSGAYAGYFSSDAPVPVRIGGTNLIVYSSGQAQMRLKWSTQNSWPTTLPGSPA